MAHGPIVTGALFLVWSKLARPQPGSVGRAMLALNIFAVIAGAFDFIFKTDYMYLRAKPQNASLLSLLGPWPWHILAAEGAAFAIFLPLYLLFRQAAQLPKPHWYPSTHLFVGDQCPICVRVF